MDGTLADGVVRVGGDARQRFHDARGYGRPLDRNRIELAPVEAAHLLSRGDLDAVAVADDGDGDAEEDENGPDGDSQERLDFRAFLARTGDPLRFTVYKDLRDRGFYLSPARVEWPGVAGAAVPETDPGEETAKAAGGLDFVVYPRGKGPWDEEVAYRVRVVGERAAVPAASLGDIVLAVVDEDGELTYFEADPAPAIGNADRGDGGDNGAAEGESDAAEGDSDGVESDAAEGDSDCVESDAAEGDSDCVESDALLPADVDADLLADRVVCYEAADALYERRFYGQRLFGRNADSGPLQLSLVEGAYLAQRDVVGVDPAAVVERGRDVEGDRFDRRLRVYAALRDRGVVPKSGFKFGADFRVYTDFTDVDSLSHSTDLVRVLDPGHDFYPRDLSLDVRLAGGVRKRMVFALAAANGEIDWLSVARLTP
ncbi:tRNA-intron lyase [Halobellus marinus]|uniref:tRNA-intron lyase n=1 Tax=Halobellus TaxID=1073986 RepID=UPI0028A61BA3|nr:tRNA-intron lyase [Halobellus sp. DFY28]